MTESKIRTAIKDKLAPRTVFVVTQRVTGAMNSDKIIVMDNGKVVGIGKHEELLQNCSVYNEIFISQSGRSFYEIERQIHNAKNRFGAFTHQIRTGGYDFAERASDGLRPFVAGGSRQNNGNAERLLLGNFRTDDLIGEIGPKLIVLAVIYGVYAVLSYLQVPLLNNTVSRHFTYGLRVDISNKLSRVPVSFADKTRPGEVLNRMNNDVSNMSTPVYSIVNVFLLGAVQIVAILTMLFIIKWQLALVVTAVVPLSLFTGAKLSARAEKYFDKTFETDGKISSHAEETYGGYSTIKAFNLENNSFKSSKSLTASKPNFPKKPFSATTS